MRKALGREGETVRFGEVGAQLGAAVKALPASLTAAADAARTGVTTLLPGEKPYKGGAMPMQPGSELAPAASLKEGATYHDALGAAFGLIRGMRDGFISAGALAKTGEKSPFIDVHYSPLGAIPDVGVGPVNIPLGNVLRAPGRMIAAIHSFFRATNYSMEKAAGAYRIAANEGLEGNALAARVGEIRQNPKPEQMEQWRDVSNDLTLMGHGGEFTRNISKLFNTSFDLPILGQTQVLKFISPFVHIASNVIDQSLIQRTPLGLLAPELRADLMGRNGNLAADKAAAKMLVGTALSITFGGLAAEGYVSGSGPSDPKESAMWRLAGNQPHSVRIGDMWYDMHRLGPMGMLLGMSADLYGVAHKASEGEMIEAASHLQHAITQNVLDESFMRGPADLIKAIEDPGRYGDAYIRNFVSSFTPFSVGMSQMARAQDPYSRQARTVLDAIRAKTPGLSQDLLPKRDIWGEPMRHDVAGVPGLSAIYETQVSRDPVNLAMLQLGISPAQVPRKIRNVDLADQQYDDFSRLAGRMAKMRLDAIVKSPQFQTFPDHVRHDVIVETIKQSRESARGVMMMKNPSIMRQATEDKMSRLRGDDISPIE